MGQQSTEALVQRSLELSARVVQQNSLTGLHVFSSPVSCWNLELCYKPFLLQKHHCNFHSTQQSQLCAHPQSFTLKKLILKNGSTTALSRYFPLEKSQTSHWLHRLDYPVLEVMPGRTLYRTSHYIQEHVLRERRFQKSTSYHRYFRILEFKHFPNMLSLITISTSSANQIGVYNCTQQSWHISYDSVINTYKFGCTSWERNVFTAQSPQCR